MQRHPLAVLGAVALALVALAGCEPAVTDSPPGTTWQAATLTADGTDRYLAAGGPAFTTVTAPLGNTGGNTRIALVPDTPPSSDQTVCATWAGSTDPLHQPGLVLRFDGVHAVTVTRNVWGGDFTVVNVHAWDLSLPLDNGRFILMSQWQLPALGQPGNPVPLPWRACASATGGNVSFKVWPLTRSEPAAGDPCCTGSLPVTVSSGRPGVYAGHIQPGHTIAVTDIGWSAP